MEFCSTRASIYTLFLSFSLSLTHTHTHTRTHILSLVSLHALNPTPVRNKWQVRDYKWEINTAWDREALKLFAAQKLFLFLGKKDLKNFLILSDKAKYGFCVRWMVKYEATRG